MIMFLCSIGFIVLLLIASWAGGSVLYDIQTDRLMCETWHLANKNILWSMTTEHAESEKDDGNEI